jgi:hypothetical protein
VLGFHDAEGKRMKFTIECEQAEDGRWIAEVLEIPIEHGLSPIDL